MKTLTAPDLAPQTLAAPQPTSNARLDWVDNLRTLMIVLVVNMHACVTYSFVGSWYYNSPPEPTIAVKLPFLEWQGHLQSFFMGLLFFIGGYYADRSLIRRGPKRFIGERFRRLGIPALLYMVAIHPLIVLVMHPGYERSQDPWHDYVQFLSSGRFLGASGPMWFAVTLLIFSLAFVPVASRLRTAAPKPFTLRPVHILGLGIGVGLVSFLIRTVQPIGTSILNLQFCFFAQYVVVFVLGVWCSRRGLLQSLADSAVARKAGIWALVLGPIALIGVFLASLPLPSKGPSPFFGGWNLPALGLAEWEQIVGVSLGLGVMAFCARRLKNRTPLAAWLSDRSFGVYLLHPPVLVVLALLMQPARTNALEMSIVLTVAGLVVSFGVADLARRIPLLKVVL